MSKPIITTDNLGKHYQLGLMPNQTQYRGYWLGTNLTLRDSFARRGQFDLAATQGRRRKSDEEDGSFWALRNVSLEVHRGELVGLIGRNGAGKSTLLKILSRIVDPTEGIGTAARAGCYFAGGWHGFSSRAHRSGEHLSQWRDPGDEESRDRRKFDEIVAFSEVEQFLDTPVKRYSSGMYVRLAFAVAAHLEPEILIVDEVLAVGDHAFQKKCLGKMREVAAGDGRTVLFVSHNMGALGSAL